MQGGCTKLIWDKPALKQQFSPTQMEERKAGQGLTLWEIDNIGCILISDL